MTISQPKLSHMLAGGVSLAAIALVAMNTNLVQTLPFADRDATEPEDNAPVSELSQVKDDRARALVDRVDGKSVTAKTGLESVSETKQLAGSREQELAANLPASAPREADRLERNLSLDEAPDAAKPSVQGQLVAQERINQGQAVHGKAETRVARKKVAGEAFRTVGRQDVVTPTYQDQGRDRFTDITPNPVKMVTEDPVSTFSVDVDTASYSFTRAALNRGVLPQKDAVRVEEMINYFDYGYAGPDDREAPFKANISIMPTPWNEGSKLLRVGIKGFELPKSEAPRANLVFLIDSSGSMNSPDKLPLLVNSFKLLLNTLKPDDMVSIVTYAGSAGTVLEPTRAAEKSAILGALERLQAGGSTAGAEGIRQAYQLAERQMDPDGVNRVILATDGDFNVGITDIEELKSFVERKRKTGVTLSVLGFGHGNYNDELMQTLAQNGNGNAAYVDTLNEARKILVEEAGSTLFTIAKDVKLQIEFNPETVKEYRLIGYETRKLNREDFNNDKVDAGDIGAGHTVTAIYEFMPTGGNGLVDPLRYQKQKNPVRARLSDEYGFLKIRYKLPDSDTSQLITAPITKAAEVDGIAGATDDMRFAAAVAAFGQILRGGRHTGSFKYGDVVDLARSAKGADSFGYRAEFINLVQLAESAAALEPQRR